MSNIKGIHPSTANNDPPIPINQLFSSKFNNQNTNNKSPPTLIKPSSLPAASSSKLRPWAQAAAMATSMPPPILPTTNSYYFNKSSTTPSNKQQIYAPRPIQLPSRHSELCSATNTKKIYLTTKTSSSSTKSASCSSVSPAVDPATDININHSSSILVKPHSPSDSGPKDTLVPPPLLLDSAKAAVDHVPSPTEPICRSDDTQKPASHVMDELINKFVGDSSWADACEEDDDMDDMYHPFGPCSPHAGRFNENLELATLNHPPAARNTTHRISPIKPTELRPAAAANTSFSCAQVPVEPIAPRKILSRRSDASAVYPTNLPRHPQLYPATSAATSKSNNNRFSTRPEPSSSTFNKSMNATHHHHFAHSHIHTPIHQPAVTPPVMKILTRGNAHPDRATPSSPDHQQPMPAHHPTPPSTAMYGPPLVLNPPHSVHNPMAFHSGAPIHPTSSPFNGPYISQQYGTTGSSPFAPPSALHHSPYPPPGTTMTNPPNPFVSTSDHHPGSLQTPPYPLSPAHLHMQASSSPLSLPPPPYYVPGSIPHNGGYFHPPPSHVYASSALHEPFSHVHQPPFIRPSFVTTVGGPASIGEQHHKPMLSPHQPYPVRDPPTIPSSPNRANGNLSVTSPKQEQDPLSSGSPTHTPALDSFLPVPPSNTNKPIGRNSASRGTSSSRKSITAAVSSAAKPAHSSVVSSSNPNGTCKGHYSGGRPYSAGHQQVSIDTLDSVLERIKLTLAGGTCQPISPTALANSEASNKYHSANPKRVSIPGLQVTSPSNLSQPRTSPDPSPRALNGEVPSTTSAHVWGSPLLGTLTAEASATVRNSVKCVVDEMGDGDEFVPAVDIAVGMADLSEDMTGNQSECAAVDEHEASSVPARVASRQRRQGAAQPDRLSNRRRGNTEPRSFPRSQRPCPKSEPEVEPESRRSGPKRGAEDDVSVNHGKLEILPGTSEKRNAPPTRSREPRRPRTNPKHEDHHRVNDQRESTRNKVAVNDVSISGRSRDPNRRSSGQGTNVRHDASACGPSSPTSSQWRSQNQRSSTGSALKKKDGETEEVADRNVLVARIRHTIAAIEGTGRPGKPAASSARPESSIQVGQKQQRVPGTQPGPRPPRRPMVVNEADRGADQTDRNRGRGRRSAGRPSSKLPGSAPGVATGSDPPARAEK